LISNIKRAPTLVGAHVLGTDPTTRYVMLKAASS